MRPISAHSPGTACPGVCAVRHMAWQLLGQWSRVVFPVSQDAHHPAAGTVKGCLGVLETGSVHIPDPTHLWVPFRAQEHHSSRASLTLLPENWTQSVQRILAPSFTGQSVVKQDGWMGREESRIDPPNGNAWPRVISPPQFLQLLNYLAQKSITLQLAFWGC